MSVLNAELPEIIPGERPPVLLLGNGINLMFQGTPWKEIIAEFAKENEICCEESALKHLPATMQIVAVSGNHIDSRMARLADKLLQEKLTEEQKAFLLDILNLPAEQIITTNYTYELEQTLEPAYSRGRAGKSTYYTVDKLDSSNDMQLHRFTKLPLQDEQRYIWHIHGLAYKPSSIVIGHYYYGKLLSQIQRYVGGMIARYKAAESQGRAFTPKSWVDYFLTGDVHILGFGMDSAEFDLWWLICCKQRNFKDSKIYFYTRGVEPEQELLMRAYGIEIVDCKKESYLKSYQTALQGIKERMGKC